MHETFVFISFKLAILPITFNISQNSYAFLARAQRPLVASKTGQPISVSLRLLQKTEGRSNGNQHYRLTKPL